MNSKSVLKTRALKFFIFFAPLIAFWLFQKTPVYITGATMGTTYSIKAYIPRWMSAQNLKSKIDEELIKLNKSMSTWDETSEISRFNNNSSLSKFKISKDFYFVLEKSKYLYSLTNGSWDGSVEPLLKLWGFSANTKLQDIGKIKIKSKKLLKEIGFDKFSLMPPNFIKKKAKHLSINLSSIAKGYGVDVVAKLLENEDIKSYFVEIGGEVFAKNTNVSHNDWRIGISVPNIGDFSKEVFYIISLNDKAVATSGDYRNYIQTDKRLYSHIIDPKTALPIQNNIASVSVVANKTWLADGLATAFMVMDINKSLSISNKLDNVEVLIVKREKDKFKIFKSDNFPKNLKIKSKQ